MGNQCGQPTNKSNQHDVQIDTTNSHMYQANIDFIQEFDNPKRQILDSKFLISVKYMPNDLNSIKVNKLSLKSLQQPFSINLPSLKYSIIQIDSQLYEDDKLLRQKDEVKNDPLRTQTDNKIINFSSNQMFKFAKNQSIISNTKQYIVSQKNIFKQIQIQPQKFITIQYIDIIKNYQIKQKIGQGSFGSVYRSVCLRTGQVRAIKIIKKSKAARKSKQLKQVDKIGKQFDKKLHPSTKQLKQLQFLSMLDHPNIVKIFQVYFFKQTYYIVMQYCSGGSIVKYFKKHNNYSQQTVRSIIKQILGALSYLHSLKIAHRDIKLQNIAFINSINQNGQQEAIIKLIDFGQSLKLKLPTKNKDLKLIGTIIYMAPQVIQGLYSDKCDVWSCGVILYTLLSGGSPFQQFNKEKTIQCIKNKVITLKDEYWSKFSVSVKQLIVKMLEKDPMQRISAKNALKSAWFLQKQQKISKQKMNQVLMKLSQYYRGNNLISVIESYLTFMKTTQQERLQIARLFKKLDKDNSGRIDINQLRYAYENYDLKQSIYQTSQIQYVLTKIDKNLSRKIDLTQFMTVFYGSRKLQQQRYLEEAFHHFDINKDGVINRKQLKNALNGCQKQEINLFFQDLDVNKDQLITKDQFIKYVQEKKFL